MKIVQNRVLVSYTKQQNTIICFREISATTVDNNYKT
jgi:hypothetical protein